MSLGGLLKRFFMSYMREPIMIKHGVFMSFFFVNGAFEMTGKFRDTQVPELHAYFF